MSINVYQCCYTNAVRDDGNTVSSGWQAVDVSPDIPSDALNACVKYQNANSSRETVSAVCREQQVSKERADSIGKSTSEPLSDKRAAAKNLSQLPEETGHTPAQSVLEDKKTDTAPTAYEQELTSADSVETTFVHILDWARKALLPSLSVLAMIMLTHYLHQRNKH